MEIKFSIKSAVKFNLTALVFFSYIILPDRVFSQDKSYLDLNDNISSSETGYNLFTSDSIRHKDKSVKFRMKKSPLKAVLLSSVLPGAGQFYNESYWKIPVIAGLTGYFGYEFFRNNNLYRENRDLYLMSQTSENPSGNPSYKSLREFYRNQRDDFIWYFMIVYVLNLVDAYVDAHLFDFSVREDKSNFPGKSGTFNLNLKYKF